MAKKTILDFREMKHKQEKIVFLTAYDAMMASFEEKAGVDMILVGDSVGNNLLGYDSTLPVTMDMMIHHTKAVRRGAPNTFAIGDMPFMSYQADVKDAIRNAGRFIQESGMDAIKLEGGTVVTDQVRGIVDSGMLVMGHIGLTPQSAGQFGGWRAQGRDLQTATKIYEDAMALEKAGAFAILLEGVPAQVSQAITEECKIPILGIGAGLPCDGQLLIVYDALGMFEAFQPRFVKKYAQIGADIVKALSEYREEVIAQKFPDPQHTYGMPKEANAEFEKWLAGRKAK